MEGGKEGEGEEGRGGTEGGEGRGWGWSARVKMSLIVQPH